MCQTQQNNEALETEISVADALNLGVKDFYQQN